MLGSSELGSVAMMDVPIEDKYPRGETTLENGKSGYGNGIEVTETGGLIWLCVMTRWMNYGEPVA